jgi:hypothetical protein
VSDGISSVARGQTGGRTAAATGDHDVHAIRRHGQAARSPSPKAAARTRSGRRWISLSWASAARRADSATASWSRNRRTIRSCSARGGAQIRNCSRVGIYTERTVFRRIARPAHAGSALRLLAVGAATPRRRALSRRARKRTLLSEKPPCARYRWSCALFRSPRISDARASRSRRTSETPGPTHRRRPGWRSPDWSPSVRHDGDDPTEVVREKQTVPRGSIRAAKWAIPSGLVLMRVSSVQRPSRRQISVKEIYSNRTLAISL